MPSKKPVPAPKGASVLSEQALALLDSTLSRCPPAFAEHVRGVLGMEHLNWTVVDGVKDAKPAWRSPSQAVLITGDLHVDGNVIAHASKHDDSYLVVLGSVHCRNLIVGDGAAFLCAGALVAQEAIVCTAMGSVTMVAGDVQAKLLDSGQGAWIDVFAKEQIAAVQHLSSYVMVGGTPDSAEEPADLTELAVKAVLDTEEWDELDPEEQEDEDKADYVRIDARKASQLLAKGQSILV